MPNASELVKLIKKTALDAVEASKPCNVCYGEVTSISPLKIEISQKLVLTKQQIVLTECVTEHTREAVINGTTQEIKYIDGLAIGDMVILLRAQGGQKYIVVGRGGA